MLVSEATARKLAQKHGLEANDVVSAVQCRPGLRVVWNTHPDRGTRAIIETFIGGRRVLVVLYPVQGDPFGDTFHLGSAYPDEG